MWILDAGRDMSDKEHPQVTELQESNLLMGVSLHRAFGWAVKKSTGTKMQGYSKESKKEKLQEDKGENKHLILLL